MNTEDKKLELFAIADACINLIEEMDVSLESLHLRYKGRENSIDCQMMAKEILAVRAFLTVHKEDAYKQLNEIYKAECSK